jgi:phage pi2 protein 07
MQKEPIISGFMNKFLMLLAFFFIFLSCKHDISTDSIDKKVAVMDSSIKNGKYALRNFSEIKSFVPEMTCYFADNNKPVCLHAFEGSPYGCSEFKFYISEGKLIYARIEFTELKKKYWDTMDTVVFNKNNSDITLEQTYFLSNDNKLIKTNNGDINILPEKREKVILAQFNELYELTKK